MNFWQFWKHWNLIFMKIPHLKVQKISKTSKFWASKKVKMAVFDTLKLPNLISRKIWMAGKSWNLHTIVLIRLSRFVNFEFAPIHRKINCCCWFLKTPKIFVVKTFWFAILASSSIFYTFSTQFIDLWIFLLIRFSSNFEIVTSSEFIKIQSWVWQNGCKM